MKSTLQGKNILLGISGSIAAYKSAFLTRLLIKKGAEVRVVMTPASCSFISPLTLSTLSRHKVHTDVSDGESWDSHVDLGLWADAIVIAPATATTIGKMANGIADNMLVASYLSAKCPVYLAPAMDLDMWKHGSTHNNLTLLQSYGNRLIDVGSGELASGLYGDGRMAEPEDIVARLETDMMMDQDLAGKRVLISAGPTYEAIDPVRFIGNHSSGKMGIALAEECISRGASVVLVLGPSKLIPQDHRIQTLRITTAHEMYSMMNDQYQDADIVIFAAAVSDFTPESPAKKKIKKKEGSDSLDIRLIKTVDIAATLGMKKKDGCYHVGFALETDNEEANAKKKISKKNFDLIVLNSMADTGAGFGHDTNKITIFHADGKKIAFSLKSKNEVATDIVNEVVKSMPSDNK